MGVRLIVEVLDYAPASLTPRERYVLIVMAESARDATRVCWPGIEDDEVFIRRSRLNSRSQRYAVLKALIEKGALENVVRGQKGIRAGYRIAAMAPVGAKLPAPQGPEKQDPDSSGQGPGNQDAENRDADAQGPGSGTSGSRKAGFRVPESRTPSPQSPQSPHSFGPENDSNNLFPDLDEKTTKDDMPKAPKKKTAAPEDMEITDRMREWAAENTPGLDLALETQKFLNHHGAKGSKFVDWVKAWRNWMINARQYAEERQQKQQGRLRVVGGTRHNVAEGGYWSSRTDEELKDVL